MSDRQHPPFFSPCTAHIDLGRIRRNLFRLTPNPQNVMPVIKSDAYGHGLLPVARVLAEAGVRHFAVGTAEEAFFLREAGFNQFILPLLGTPHKDALARAQSARVTVLVHDPYSLRRVAAEVSPGASLDIAIKCETGMARLGFSPEELPAVLEFLRTNPQLRPVLALSHLSCADMPEMDNYTRQQGATFASMCESLAAVFPHVRRSLCNSAGCLAYREMAGDLLRPGQAIYGGNALYGTAWEHRGTDFEEAMSLSTTVLQVHDVPEGQGVSYGATFVAKQPTRLAVLGVGYADGFSRSMSSQGRVSIHRQVAPIRGRVCMGLLMADVTHIEGVQAGDTAWLAGGPGPLSMQDLADSWGSIIYEAQCLLGRNKRVYSE